MVRLKGSREIRKRQKVYDDFNSNMVRLKAENKENTEGGNEFQFQYGAIKSLTLSGRQLIFMSFQFQYGAIKRRKVSSEIKNTLYISIPIWCD